MSHEEEQRNKEIVTAFVEATNKLELDKLDEMVVEDYLEHQPIPGQPPGREGLNGRYQRLQRAVPGLRFDFADVIAEGDLVVGRGSASTAHRAASSGIRRRASRSSGAGRACSGSKDGQIVEGWVNLDMLGMMQQLGRHPAPPPGPTRHRRRHLTGAPSTREANHALMSGSSTRSGTRATSRSPTRSSIRRRRARARRRCRPAPRA